MPKQVYFKSYRSDLDSSRALQFDGVNDYVSIPSIGYATNPNITVEGWINCQVATGIHEVFTLGNGNFFLRCENNTGSSGTFKLEIGGTNAFFVVPRYRLNWLHFAIACTPGTATVYANGVLIGTMSATMNLSSQTNQTLGIERGLGLYPFSGFMDEFRFWNIARTQGQILASMSSRLIGNESNLQAYYRLDETVGTTAFDSTSNARNGTLTNFTGTPWTAVDVAPLTKTSYAGYFDEWTSGSISTNMNGGPGGVEIDIPKPFNNFGEGVEIDYNNRIDYWVYDNDTPTGIQIYSGYIYKYQTTVGNGESVKVSLAGYISKLEKDTYTSNAGLLKESFVSTEIAAIFKKIIDNFRASNPGTPINYTSTSIPNTGVSRGITFNTQSYLDCLKATIKLLPETYYWYLDVDNIIYLKQVATTAKHLFYFEKDIQNLSDARSIEALVNQLFFWNGLPAADPNVIAKTYTRSRSIVKFGKSTDKKSDNRYTLVASADDFAARTLNLLDSPTRTIELDVIDNNFGFGYDIESIKPGDTFKIMNSGTDMPVMIVNSLTYSFGSVKIVAQDVRAYLERTAYDLKKTVDQAQYDTNAPSSYS